jgi:mRNA interferase MazF
MARGVNRGEIWMYALKDPDQRRPVVILSRQSAIPFMRTVIVAPITSTIRGIPSEVEVGVEEGLKQPSTIKLDNVQAVDRSQLHTFVGSLSSNKMRAVCRALAIATGCDL